MAPGGRDHQRGPEVTDQDVLAHVGGEEVVVRDPVERSHEREDGDGEAGREQRDAVPAGEVGAAPASQPDDGLGEEERCERGDDHRSHGLDCA